MGCSTKIKRAVCIEGNRNLIGAAKLNGLDIDKNAIPRIESGQRFVTDIELTVISKVLNKSYSVLLDTKK